MFGLSHSNKFLELLKKSRRSEQEAAELALVLRDNMCAFLLFAAAYFTVNTLFYRIDGDPGYIPALSIVTLIAIIVFWIYNRRKASLFRIELTGHILGLTLVANALLDICLEYHSTKLMFLLLLLPTFAISGARARAVLTSFIAAIASFLGAAYVFEPENFVNCVWVAFAGIVVGGGLATVIRQSMLNAVRAKITSDQHRDEALSLATFDALTGLANRRAFLRMAEERLSKPGQFYLGLVDLDGFKPINDIFGHAAGDQVLTEVAQRLCLTCGTGAAVARLGGDEFAVIISDIPDDEAWRYRVERISEVLAAPYIIGTDTAHLSASLGFARRDPESTDLVPSKLLERADYALYEAKELGRGMAVLFEPHHEELIRSTKAIEQALRRMDSSKELTLAFQPQHDLIEERTVAFEALARWHSDRLGHVPPDVFIRAAERSGLITSLTPLLLEKALVAARHWPEPIRLAFNLSARDILSPVATRRIADVVRTSGFAPERIEFEITETAMLTDFVQAEKNIGILRKLGCRMALDDFGSGYTNFSYINRVMVDTVKIDRSFVIELGHSNKTRKIIKSMIELAANLGMGHVVEGVETQEELRQLRTAGARHVQGYLFGKPMPESEIEGFLRREADRRAA